VTIYLDLSPAINGKAGLGRYAASLASALAPQLGERLAFFYNQAGPPASTADWAARGLPAPTGPVRSVRAGYKPWRMAVWLGQLAHAGFDRLLPGAELYHATEHLLLPLRHVPTVLTVHDLIYRHLPQHHKKLNYWFLNAAMPLFCQRASAIITISESSRQDLLRAYAVDPAKVHVIYEAAAPHFSSQPAARIAEVRARYALPEHFLLTVGTIEPRKNLERLLDTLLILRRDGHDAHLVIVGSRGWLTEGFERKLAMFPAREAVHLPGYVADADLSAVYSAARITVLASVYEGFGLPVLEGMACGSPVVCSHTSSLPELGGLAARYFDPYDVDDMAANLAAVWRDDDLRAEMRTQGLTQAAQFSWSRTAAQTLAVYQSLLPTIAPPLT
jgi:glycosyltransferase involved in cell wall biosynthesis